MKIYFPLLGHFLALYLTFIQLHVLGLGLITKSLVLVLITKSLPTNNNTTG